MTRRVTTTVGEMPYSHREQCVVLIEAGSGGVLQKLCLVSWAKQVFYALFRIPVGPELARLSPSARGPRTFQRMEKATIRLQTGHLQFGERLERQKRTLRF